MAGTDQGHAMQAVRMPLAPFVGREKEAAALAARLESARGGDGGAVFIGGEPGIGKSRLLREFAGKARAAGWLVLSGRAYDTEGMPPYLPFVEVIREGLPATSAEALARFAGEAPALCLLLPEVSARVPKQAAPPSAGPEGDRFRLFEAVSRFLTTMAGERESGGLLVLLDDLHWADRTTLLLLQHLTRKLTGTPMLIAAAYRTTDIDPGHPLTGVIADLTRDHQCEQVLLQPLSLMDAWTMADATTGAATSPAFARSLHRETEGNPFFIEEVLRHLVERGADLSGDPMAVGETLPESVRQVIRQRTSHLGDATNAMLRAAAVLGDAIDLELLSATCQLDPQPLANAVEEAERAGMIRPENQGYVFGHCLIRRTIYDGLTVPRRRQLHLRAAEAMEAGDAGRRVAAPAVIAHHWRLGGYPSRAIEYLLRAGDAAIRVTAWDEAAQHWESALECMEQSVETPQRRARLLEGLGDIYFLSSFEAHPAVERYVRAAGLYESADDPAGAARARSLAGRSLAYPTSGFDYGAAVEHLRAAEKVLSQEPESVELGELYAALAHAESHALRSGPAEMLQAMRSLREIADKLDSDFLRDLLRIQSSHLEGHYLGLQGHLAGGIALEQAACDIATDLKDKPGPVSEWPRRWQELLVGHSIHSQGELPPDAGSFQFSRVHSRAGLVNMTTNCCGWQSLDLNDPIPARAQHERIRDAQGRFLSPFLIYDLFLSADLESLRDLMASGSLSPFGEAAVRAPWMLAWGEGRLDEAESALTAAAVSWRASASNSLIVFTNRYLVRLYRAMGQASKAASAAEESLAIAVATEAVKYEFGARSELMLLAAETGRLPEAEIHRARCREILAQGEDWRGLGGRELLAEGASAAASGRRDEAEAQFAGARDVFRDLCLPWDEAETYEVWARTCGRFSRGRVRRAFILDKLAAAGAVYQRVGAGQPWLDRLVAQERSLVGVTAVGAARDLPDGLTVREVEVLRLVALGSSSRQIGEELVLSVRTVERHIANIYLKTGTHNRAQMTAYALTHGLAVSNP